MGEPQETSLGGPGWEVGAAAAALKLKSCEPKRGREAPGEGVERRGGTDICFHESLSHPPLKEN